MVTASANNLVMLVALPENGLYAPGRTFAIPFDQLYYQPAAPGCVAPTCATLPPLGIIQTTYLISPQLAANTFPLGNEGLPYYTSLPAQATYRLLWPPTSSSSPTSEQAGLPVGPALATTIGGTSVAPSLRSFPSPAHGTTLAFETYLQAGAQALYYERVITPVAPFDQYYAPEVKIVTVSQGSAVEADEVDSFDVTQETAQGPTIPTFDVSRVDGLDGWSVFLRDTTRQVISPVVALAGTQSHVVLPTNHLRNAGDDALSGAQLVLQPPQGTAIPTGVFSPVANVLPAEETYPRLPAPVLVEGNVLSETGAPVPANLVFEAQSIADTSGQYNSTNFEFRVTVSAPTTQGPNSASFAVTLPQGKYNLAVRPLDGASQLTVVPVVIDARSQPSVGRDVVVAPLRRIAGSALVADGRPLFGATIEADPIGCLDGTTDAACMPREVQAPTAIDGTYAIRLDPGSYVLRAEPAAGSRLPWTSQLLSVEPSQGDATAAPIFVPAPASAGLSLVDPTGRPVADAVVRVFSLQSGRPVELGDAVTGPDGSYELFIPPGGQ